MTSMPSAIHPSALREYDIRGIVGQTLDEAAAYAVGRSFGTAVCRRGGSRIVVGYDGRLTSPSLEAELIRGLVETGIAVVRIGLGPSPMLYFAEAVLDVDAGIQVTGSHNPASHNGFKFVLNHGPFFGPDIQMLGRLARDKDWDAGHGSVETVDIMDRYTARLAQGTALAAMRVGWDAGNGAAGPVVERLVKLLPGDHHLLYTDVDGTFPNHHPDPTEEANLEDLRALVREKRLDLGVAFDGDGDRIGAVDSLGRVIWGDQLLAILAETVLRNEPGATIIADVKASQSLFDRIAELGGHPMMWKTGHSHIKSKMRETGSPLAGEMSGHIFFKQDYYGFDDGLYAAVRLIRAASELGRSVTELRGAMPELINTPELRFPVPDDRKFTVIAEVLDRLSKTGVQVDRTDGARVTTADGWWLLRASNTQAVLVARAEAKFESGLKCLLGEIDAQLALSGVSRTADLHD